MGRRGERRPVFAYEAPVSGPLLVGGDVGQPAPPVATWANVDYGVANPRSRCLTAPGAGFGLNGATNPMIN
jgi:hypothetical protein